VIGFAATFLLPARAGEVKTTDFATGYGMSVIAAVAESVGGRILTLDDHFEELVRASDNAPSCPECGASNVLKQLSVFATHGAAGEQPLVEDLDLVHHPREEVPRFATVGRRTDHEASPGVPR
jgi:hypothetical protein